MKYLKYITNGALFALLLAGCSDDLDNKPVALPVSGDEIQFGATPGGFTDVDPTTRTIYHVPDGSTFDNYTLLNIKWQYGTDKVRVYCPEGAEGFKTADYTVSEASNASGESTGYLVKNGEAGIRWGDTSKDHHFYAFYSLDKIDNGLQADTKVTVTIPTGQEGGDLVTYNDQGEEDPNGTFKIIAPDMTFCMMAGTGTWKSGTDKNITLTFNPIVTVLDVLVNGPGDDQIGGIDAMKIVSVSVRSKSGKDIVGTFSYDFSKVGTNDSPYDFSATDNSATATSIATVQTIDKNSPVELGKGEQLNVKFFLLPRDIPEGDLVVSVLTEGGIVYNKTVTGIGTQGSAGSADGVMEAGLITRIKTPHLGGQTTNNWMGLVPDNVLFSQLSLPGSKHSFAYTVDPNFNAESGLSQFYQAIPPLGINATTAESTQFDEGIRVFDVHLDLTNGTTSGTPIVYAGGQPLNPQITLVRVLDVLNSKLHPSGKDPTECAVVFLNFVWNATGSVETWMSAVMNALDSWNKDNPYILTTLGNNTTMGQVRGKIAIIINIGDDQKPSGSAPVNYINNFSTSVQNTSIVEVPYSSGTNVRIQNLQQCNNPQLTSGEPYAYRDGIGLVPYYITQANFLDSGVSCDLIEIKKNLIRQINQEIASGSSNLFINDLSGFCVTKNEESTGWMTYIEYRYSSGRIWSQTSSSNGTKYYDYNQYSNKTRNYKYIGPKLPDVSSYNIGDYCLVTSNTEKGNGGNTCLFAEYINPIAVAEYSALVGNLRQPLGIVLMNFAGVATVSGSSQTYQVQGVRLPGMIVMNNFMFPLKTGETTVTRCSSKAIYFKGNDAWD